MLNIIVLANVCKYVWTRECVFACDNIYVSVTDLLRPDKQIKNTSKTMLYIVEFPRNLTKHIKTTLLINL